MAPLLAWCARSRAGNGHQADRFWAVVLAATYACYAMVPFVQSALVLLRLAPWQGLVFLAIAISIALGAVAGRYHYAADAVLGAIVAAVAFLVI